MRVTLAKLIWKYDLQLLNDSVDWQQDSRMHTVWKMPKLFVAVSEAAR